MARSRHVIAAVTWLLGAQATPCSSPPPIPQAVITNANKNLSATYSCIPGWFGLVVNATCSNNIWAPLTSCSLCVGPPVPSSVVITAVNTANGGNASLSLACAAGTFSDPVLSYCISDSTAETWAPPPPSSCSPCVLGAPPTGAVFGGLLNSSTGDAATNGALYTCPEGAFGSPVVSYCNSSSAVGAWEPAIQCSVCSLPAGVSANITQTRIVPGLGTTLPFVADLWCNANPSIRVSQSTCQQNTSVLTWFPPISCANASISSTVSSTASPLSQTGTPSESANPTRSGTVTATGSATASPPQSPQSASATGSHTGTVTAASSSTQSTGATASTTPTASSTSPASSRLTPTATYSGTGSSTGTPSATHTSRSSSSPFVSLVTLSLTPMTISGGDSTASNAVCIVSEAWLPTRFRVTVAVAASPISNGSVVGGVTVDCGVVFDSTLLNFSSSSTIGGVTRSSSGGPPFPPSAWLPVIGPDRSLIVSSSSANIQFPSPSSPAANGTALQASSAVFSVMAVYGASAHYRSLGGNAYSGTLSGTLVCALRDASSGTSTSSSSTAAVAAFLPLMLLSPAWPLLADVLVHLPGGLVRSTWPPPSATSTALNITAELLSADDCGADGYTSNNQSSSGGGNSSSSVGGGGGGVIVPCNTSTALNNSVAVEFVLNSAGLGAGRYAYPPSTSSSSGGVSNSSGVTLSGQTHITLVAAPGSYFSSASTVYIDTIACETVWATEDGGLLHVVTPSYSAVCTDGATSSGSGGGCGYHQITVVQPDAYADYDSATLNSSSSAALGGDVVSNSEGPLSLSVSCPPFCPGLFPGSVPLPRQATATTLSNSSAAASALNDVQVQGGVVMLPALFNASVAAALIAGAEAAAAAAAGSVLASRNSSSSSSGGGGVAWFLEGAWPTPVPVPLLQIQSSVLSSGVYYTPVCVGYPDPTTSTFCTNASDLAHGTCAYGSGDACVPCPSGALCPGGFRLWSLPGYYVPASLLPIVQCAPPSSERCTGWDASMGVTACGAGYRPGSIGCGACAPGYYTALDQSCSPCPANGSILPLLYPLFSFIAATVGFAGLNYGLIVAAVRIAGGTVYGGTNRSLQLMIWIFTVVQLLAQVGKAAAPGLPAYILAFYEGLDVFQFGGLAPPAACLSGTYPFAVQAFQMGLVLGLCALVIVMLRTCLTADSGTNGSSSAPSTTNFNFDDDVAVSAAATAAVPVAQQRGGIVDSKNFNFGWSGVPFAAAQSHPSPAVAAAAGAGNNRRWDESSDSHSTAAAAAASASPTIDDEAAMLNEWERRIAGHVPATAAAAAAAAAAANSATISRGSDDGPLLSTVTGTTTLVDPLQSTGTDDSNPLVSSTPAAAATAICSPLLSTAAASLESNTSNASLLMTTPPTALPSAVAVKDKRADVTVVPLLRHLPPPPRGKLQLHPPPPGHQLQLKSAGTAGHQLQLPRCSVQRAGTLLLRALFTVLTLVYPLVTRSALTMLFCDNRYVSVMGYLAMDNNGAALSAAHITLPADDGAESSSSSSVDVALLFDPIVRRLYSTTLTVSTLQFDEYYVCYEASHLPVGVLAWFTVFCFVLGYPIVTFLWVRAALIDAAKTSSSAATPATVGVKGHASASNDVEIGDSPAFISYAPGSASLMQGGGREHSRAQFSPASTCDAGAVNSLHHPSPSKQLQLQTGRGDSPFAGIPPPPPRANTQRLGELLIRQRQQQQQQQQYQQQQSYALQKKPLQLGLKQQQQQQQRAHVQAQVRTPVLPRGRGILSSTQAPSAQPSSMPKGTAELQLSSGAAYPANAHSSSSGGGSGSVIGDPRLSAWTRADYTPRVFYARHAEFASLALLSCMIVFWAAPSSVSQAVGKLFSSWIVILGLLSFFVLWRPFPSHDGWKAIVKAFSLVLAACAALLNCLISIRSITILSGNNNDDSGGADALPLSTSITAMSFIVFVLSLALFITLIVAFWRALLAGAAWEQHRASVRFQQQRQQQLEEEAARTRLLQRQHVYRNAGALILPSQQQQQQHAQSTVAQAQSSSAVETFGVALGVAHLPASHGDATGGSGSKGAPSVSAAGAIEGGTGGVGGSLAANQLRRQHSGSRLIIPPQLHRGGSKMGSISSGINASTRISGSSRLNSSSPLPSSTSTRRVVGSSTLVRRSKAPLIATSLYASPSASHADHYEDDISGVGATGSPAFFTVPATQLHLQSGLEGVGEASISTSLEPASSWLSTRLHRQSLSAGAAPPMEGAAVDRWSAASSTQHHLAAAAQLQLASARSASPSTSRRLQLAPQLQLEGGARSVSPSLSVNRNYVSNSARSNGLQQGSGRSIQSNSSSSGRMSIPSSLHSASGRLSIASARVSARVADGDELQLGSARASAALAAAAAARAADSATWNRSNSSL